MEFRIFESENYINVFVEVCSVYTLKITIVTIVDDKIFLNDMRIPPVVQFSPLRHTRRLFRISQHVKIYR